ncbi:MAG: phosphoribosylamine--glycine ligase [Sulfolobales archaeon]|nr:phosphoribosylamine--glycine ligase [Sulfolobales archaeon]MDW8010779.1 phosphoribosylamine--glycine ligase [Sulfolobales archaeon]
MKVLLVGSGGREHALAKLITSSQMSAKLYVLSDYANPGLMREAELSGGKLFVATTTFPENVVKIAELVSPDLVVVGPEEPQFHGVVDYLRERGFYAFGASRRCSSIERSKVFARYLMWKHSIPGRLYYVAFKSLDDAREFVKYAGDVVVKPARQVGGKGVRVIKDTKAFLSEAKHQVKSEAAFKTFEEISKYGDVDYSVLVEQRVDGVEYTAQVVTDGSYVLPLPLVQDHPHAYELDLGYETGGMGCISGPGHLLPFIDQGEYETTQKIVREVLERLQEEVKERYTGAFAGQMMLTGLWGPTAIEYYSRFGDPEISCLLPRVESDFLEVLDRAARGALSGAKVGVSDEVVSVVKAVAPVGYPVSRDEARGHPVTVDVEKIRGLGCEVLYASVELGSDGRTYTKGSRAFEVVCSASSYEEAHRVSELAVSYVTSLDGWPLYHRSDVGSSELVEERIREAERVRRVYRSKHLRGTLGEFFTVWLPGRGVVGNPLLSPLRWEDEDS